MDKGIRATNYLIDFSIIIILWIGITIVFRNSNTEVSDFYFLMFLYYLILELFFRQTIGKMITKTIVVKKDGKRANFLNILIRSFLRLIPIDNISYLFGTERGFHDVLSSTKLIKK